jgi:hypothetical protein
MVHRGVVSGRDLEIKGNQWNTANIDLAAYKGQNVQLRINGITELHGKVI